MRRPLPFLLAAFLACGADGASSGDGPCPEVRLLVAGSDYSSAVACGAPGCFEVAGKTTGRPLGSDPMLVSSNGRTFFLARDEDTIFNIDPSCGTPDRGVKLDAFARTDARGKKRSANPHDVAVADDGTLFVALYNTPALVFVKGDAVDGPPIDLSAYDEDGNPQAESVRIVNGKAFVALERLDDRSDPPLQSRRPSQMLRIDVATRTAEAIIELAGRNPFNAMAQLGSALFLAEPNNTDVADEELGGIERFDTMTSTTQLLVRERDVGGSVTEIAVTDGCGAAIVVAPIPKVNPSALVTFDPTTGEVLSTFAAPVLGPTPGFDLQGLVWRDGKLYVGDRRQASNGKYQVHELALTAACTLRDTGHPIDLPQPPVGLQAARQ
ncbi:MAG: hypothetical protein U0270_39960 [Labilithrix sp.]